MLAGGGSDLLKNVNFSGGGSDHLFHAQHGTSIGSRSRIGSRDGMPKPTICSKFTFVAKFTNFDWFGSIGSLGWVPKVTIVTIGALGTPLALGDRVGLASVGLATSSPSTSPNFPPSCILFTILFLLLSI